MRDPAGSGYDRMNCDQGFFLSLNDQEDFFYKHIFFGNHKHIFFGNHLVVAYGDYRKELKMLGEAFGLEVVFA